MRVEVRRTEIDPTTKVSRALGLVDGALVIQPDALPEVEVDGHRISARGATERLVWRRGASPDADALQDALAMLAIHLHMVNNPETFEKVVGGVTVYPFHADYPGMAPLFHVSCEKHEEIGFCGERRQALEFREQHLRRRHGRRWGRG